MKLLFRFQCFCLMLHFVKISLAFCTINYFIYFHTRIFQLCNVLTWFSSLLEARKGVIYVSNCMHGWVIIRSAMCKHNTMYRWAKGVLGSLLRYSFLSIDCPVSSPSIFNCVHISWCTKYMDDMRSKPHLRNCLFLDDQLALQSTPPLFTHWSIYYYGKVQPDFEDWQELIIYDKSVAGEL